MHILVYNARHIHREARLITIYFSTTDVGVSNVQKDDNKSGDFVVPQGLRIYRKYGTV
jgi:hypothetical protein